MEKPDSFSRGPADLTECDREPIHILGRIQPYGLLFVLTEPDLTIIRVSANARELLDREATDFIGQPIDAAIGDVNATMFRSRLSRENVAGNPLYIGTISVSDRRSFHIIVHRHAGCLILELEIAAKDDDLSFANLYALVRTSTARLQQATSPDDLCRHAAEDVRRITGFDRVLVYQFDSNWNGVVVAESRVDEPEVVSYLEHHFPASDIPKQARELYRLNRVRLIADVDYTPIDLLPPSSEPLDMTYSVLRSVSPVHLEYMRNMGVRASMSVSIVVRTERHASTDVGQLWGLIACHHRTPLHVPYEARTASEAIAQNISVQLASNVRAPELNRRIELKARLARLLEHMSAHENFVRGLTSNPRDLLGVVEATGAAVQVGEELHLFGVTPTSEQTWVLIRWLSAKGFDDFFASERLSADFPESQEFAQVASGLLAISISGLKRGFILWFRPEVARTLIWAGDPHKTATTNSEGGINPRKSFRAWRESVRFRSTPWSQIEIEIAGELREAVVRAILAKAEELEELSATLAKTNKELEAFSYSVSHDLRAPFRHIVGFSQLLLDRLKDKLDPTSARYVETIAAAAKHAGSLVDGLLAFSHMGKVMIGNELIDLREVIEQSKTDVAASEAEGRSIEWRIGDLPHIRGDRTLLSLVARNLLSNAVKYTRRRERAVIEVGCFSQSTRYVIFVKDNGVGFDMAQVGKLFGVFQRLHLQEDFEGTGIGLANVRRIIERHGGQTWAEGKVNEGATIFFSFHKPPND